MRIKSLENTSLEIIVECLLKAFDGYFVKMPTDISYYQKRWEAAKVDYALSYGMFDNETLVGIIIHGIDVRNGRKTAYNTATGVLPSYRGQKITRSIYDFAIKDLVKHGIEQSILEVIQENERAIRVYESVGFKIAKEYNCFAGKIELGKELTYEIVEIDKEDFHWEGAPNQDKYSWDFQKETIEGVDYQYFIVLNNGKTESYFIYNSQNGYLAQCEVYNDEIESWSRLFCAIQKVADEVKIINVDTRLINKIKIIEKCTLKNTVNQYEMQLDFP